MSRTTQPPTMHTKLVAASVSDMVQEWYSGKSDVPHMTPDLFEQRICRFQPDLIQPAAADMSGIDRAMLQSMAASFRGALEFSFNRHDMAELMDRCAARPASADNRTVTVAQLEAWTGAMEDWDEGDAAQKIDEIRAIIGDTE